MSDNFHLSMSMPPKPAIGRKQFSLNDWTWPAVAFVCSIATVLMTTSINATADSWTLKGSPYAVMVLGLAIVVAFIKINSYRTASRKLADAIAGQPQFIVFDEHGFRFGW